MQDLIKNITELINEELKNTILWHATPLDNIPNILKKGFIPGASRPGGQSFKALWSGKGIYFHSNFPDHELDNSFDPDDKNIFTGIIEIKLDIDISRLRPDEDVSNDLTSVGGLKALRQKESIAYLGRIPKNTIKKIWIVDLGKESRNKILKEFPEFKSLIKWFKL